MSPVNKNIEVCLDKRYSIFSCLRLIQDEGFFNAIRFIWKIITYPAARKRLLAMRSVLKKYEEHIGAVALISQKSR